MNWSEKKVLVAGAYGFLGSHIVNQLQKVGARNIVIPSSKEYDLRKNENCREVVRDIDIVFNLAAHVGGIGLNRDKPGELFYDNLMIGTQLLHEAKNASVEKFVGLGTVCSYPKFSQIPFTEDSIWDGYPDETNAPYGLAKKMVIVQSQAYRKQYNFKSIVVVPTNMYGPSDHFNDTSSHVIAALILKIYNAKKNNGRENKILPPTARRIAINKDKIISKVLTLFVIFLLLALANQDNNKKVMTKMIIPVNIIFI